VRARENSSPEISRPVEARGGRKGKEGADAWGRRNRERERSVGRCALERWRWAERRGSARKERKPGVRGRRKKWAVGKGTGPRGRRGEGQAGLVVWAGFFSLFPFPFLFLFLISKLKFI
jgi:hypothetical protein